MQETRLKGLAPMALFAGKSKVRKVLILNLRVYVPAGRRASFCFEAWPG